MTRIAFFGHDSTDAAVRRRVQAFRTDGLSVIGFMMKRRDAAAPEWYNVDLGQTRDGAFLQRILRVFSGARIAARHRDQLASADIIYARNLDMLACAFLAKRHARLKTPVIYESLDVHRLLSGSGLASRGLRRLEGWLLGKTAGLVVSSPAFVRQHFARHYPGRFKDYLVENRLAPGAEYGPRPMAAAPASTPFRLGWVGILRCQRSFDLLCDLAAQHGPRIEIHLHGLPARTEIPVFEPRIEGLPNMTYHGRYQSPEDLARIYGGLDAVWAGDFMEAGYNSVWLLPNRIYEGGYYATPSIAPAGTETAAWIERHACGFTIDEPLAHTLPALIEALIDDPAQIVQKSRELLDLPAETFQQPLGVLAAIIEDVLKRKAAA